MATKSGGARTPQSAFERIQAQHEERLQRALSLHRAGKLPEAKTIYESIIATDPQHFDSLNMLGALALQTGNFEAAIAIIGKAIAINPHSAAAHTNLGNALLALKRFDEALKCQEKAIAIQFNYAEAHNNRGNALFDLKRVNEAIASYDKAITFKPDFAEAHYNRATALRRLKRFAEALAGYDEALVHKSLYADAYYNRGNTLIDLKRPEDALASYEKALALKPDQEFLLGTVLHTRMKLCKWSHLASELGKLKTGILAGRKVSTPFPVLALLDEPQLHKRVATIFAAAKHPISTKLGTYAKRPQGKKIRVGYYSADLREHAMAYLMAELFETHDRARFDMVAFSIGPTADDAMRKRITAALDQFLDVSDKNDAAIAQLSREHGIDIAVDLMGYTQDSRLGMFAYGCAPIQVNYLGYPGTTGTPYIDYIFADRTIVPPDRQEDFTEKVVYLPNCYQVNDSKRRISDRRFTRQELGLPEAGTVFCCFNNTYKILPEMFDIWMRLLKSVDGSVLWLLETNLTAATNLRKEAAARGVEPSRLVIAGRLPLDQHLARHRCADLFLDTFPYNAHTSASDALWCGLPLLTCPGTSFASRVAASLLTTIDMPELVTSSLAKYEEKALELAHDGSKLAVLKHKLEERRLSTPLFDAKLFARHIEAAYTTIYDLYQAGLPPHSLTIG